MLRDRNYEQRVKKARSHAKHEALYVIARKEVEAWAPTLNRGVVIAILYCFCLHYTTGQSYEEMFSDRKVIEPDYEI